MRDGYQLKLVAEHTWTDCPSLGDVTFSPDGKTLYLMKQPLELNLGSAAVSFWPEVLALLTLVTLVAAWRKSASALRNSQKLGSVYCRGCGYDLCGSQQGACCPECGSKKRVAGRGVARRIVPWAACAISAVTLSVWAYAGGWRAGTPMWLMPAGPYSERAMGWAERVSPEWAETHAVPAAEVVKVDARSGVIGGVLTRLGASLWQQAASPDGSIVCVVTHDGTRARVVAVDAATGEKVAVRGVEGLFSRMQAIIGFDARGRVLLAESDAERGRAWVTAWDIGSGAVEMVVEEPADTMEVADRRLLLTPAYAVSGDGKKVVSASSSLADKPVELAVIDTSTGERKPVPGDWNRVIGNKERLSLSPDGSMFYEPIGGPPACWRTSDGGRVASAAPGAHTELRGSACSAPDAGLIAATTSLGPSLVMLRWGTVEEVASVALPRPTVVMNMAVSRDGKHVAIKGFDYVPNRGKGPRPVDRVYLYELTGAGKEP